MAWVTQAFLLLVLAVASPASAQSPGIISDEDLLRYAREVFDQSATTRQVELGLNHGTMVVADFRCSDFCTPYTMRVIIHYVWPEGRSCFAIGGVRQERRVLKGWAEGPQTFCVPKVLAGLK